MESNKLFSEFPPVSKEEWKLKAIEDLKGADFDKKLAWKTDEDFSVQPFYTNEDLEQCCFNNPDLLGRKKDCWVSYTGIDVVNEAEANAEAKQLTNSGAEGFLFNINDPKHIRIEALLEGLDCSRLEISFSTVTPSIHLISEYLRYLEQQGVRLDAIKGFYECDILESWSVEGISPNFCALADVLDLLQKTPGFRGLVIRSHSFINAGSNISQEIAFTLNKLTDYFEKLGQKGIKPANLVNQLVFHLAIGGDYFLEIARIRAIRLLIKQVLELYQTGHTEALVLSSNSCWSKSISDPNVNMLRNTTEAMSAVLGGCDALLVRAHDNYANHSTKWSNRIALNISNLLKHEAYMAKVKDPASGSYYLENLTALLAEKALQVFREIEQEGGYINAFTTGIIQQKIAAVRDKKLSEIALRKRVFVGTNKYPDINEKLQSTVLQGNDHHNGIELLKPQQATQEFDQLKQKTLEYETMRGHIPTVFLACFGDMVMARARAAFAAEFFSIAAFTVMDECYSKDAVEAAKAGAGSEADIVVICSSDADYETQALSFVQAFRLRQKNKVLVLAGNPVQLAESLKDAGLDNFIHIRTNAIESLSALQEKLFEGSMNTLVLQ